jgi:hypothetical protein
LAALRNLKNPDPEKSDPEKLKKSESLLAKVCSTSSMDISIDLIKGSTEDSQSEFTAVRQAILESTSSIDKKTSKSTSNDSSVLNESVDWLSKELLDKQSPETVHRNDLVREELHILSIKRKTSPAKGKYNPSYRDRTFY